MLAACVLLLLVAGILDSRHDDHSADERAAVQIAESLCPAVRAALAARDTAAVVAALQRVQANPRVDFALVQDAEGLLVAGTSRRDFDMFQARARILAECWEPAGRETRLLTLKNGRQVMLCSIPLAMEMPEIAGAPAGNQPREAAGISIVDPGGPATAATSAGVLVANPGGSATAGMAVSTPTAAPGRQAGAGRKRGAGTLRVGVAPRGVRHLESLWRPGSSGSGAPEEPSTRSPQARVAMQKADLATQNFDVAETIRHYREAIRSDPRCAIAYARLADISSRPQPAVGLADSAMALIEGASPYERLQIQLIHAEMKGDRESCDRLTADLLEKYPEVPEVRALRARRLVDIGYRDQAIAEWRRLIQSRPDQTAVYNTLGYVLAEKGLYDEAREYLVKYAWLLPDQSNPHDSLGELFQLLGRYEDAEREYRKALRVDPGFHWPRAHLATMAAELGRYEEAEAQLREIEKGWTPIPRAIVDMAERRILIRVRTGRLGEALALAQWCETPDGSWYRSHYWRGLIFVDLGRLFDARNEAGLLLAEIKESYQAAGKLVSLAADAAEYRHLMGRIYEAEGEFEDARNNYVAAIDTHQLIVGNLFIYQKWEPRLALARLALRRGDPQGALSELATILEANPRQGEALLLTARACHELGQRARARAALWAFLTQRKGADLSPEIEMAQKLLAEIGDARAGAPAGHPNPTEAGTTPQDSRSQGDSGAGPAENGGHAMTPGHGGHTDLYR